MAERPMTDEQQERDFKNRIAVLEAAAIDEEERIAALEATAIDEVIASFFPRHGVSVANHPLAAADTTPEDVPGLVVPVDSGTRYFIEAFLKVSAPSNVPDLKTGWSQPAGSSIEYHRGLTFSGAAVGAAATALSGGNVQIGLDNLTTGIALYGWFTTAGNAGNLQFQASQNTSDAGIVTIHAGSLLRVTKLPVA